MEIQKTGVKNTEGKKLSRNNARKSSTTEESHGSLVTKCP